MRDSLLSRFRAAFLGAWLGEALYEPVGSPRRSASSPAAPLQTLRSSQLLLTHTERLLQLALEQPEQLFLGKVELAAHLPDGLPDDLAAAALVTLPLVLFYHDQPLLLQATLQAMSHSPELALGPIVIGHTCSLILRERLTPVKLIPQLVKDLDLALDRPFVQQLMQVQSWIEQPTGLAPVARWAKGQSSSEASLDQLAVALVIYSFLSTPDSLQLAISRLMQLPYQSPQTGALLGILTGLHHGLLGLPMGGQWLPANKSQSVQSSLLPEIWQLADRLLAVWSGAEQPVQWLNQPTFATLTATPRVIS